MRVAIRQAPGKKKLPLLRPSQRMETKTKKNPILLSTVGYLKHKAVLFLTDSVYHDPISY